MSRTWAYLLEAAEAEDELFDFLEPTAVVFLLFPAAASVVVVVPGGKSGNTILVGTGTMLVSVEAGVAFFFFLLGGPLQ